MQTGQTRISLKNDLSQPNAFFAEFANEIFAALINNTEPPLDNQDFYTRRRLSLYSTEERNAMLRRCPEDIQVAATPKDGDPFIDGVEIDLIDFLLNFKDNRILAIVGTVGIGKTTFLQYVFGQVREKCPSLQRFVPIVLNCLAIGNLDPTYTDLIYEASRALRRQLALSPQLMDKGNELLARFALFEKQVSDHVVVPTLPDYSSAHFVDFISEIDQLYGPDIEPVVVFDNVDQLESSAVLRISALATSLHLNTKLAVITSMRPATFLTQTQKAHGSGAIYSFRIDLAPPELRSVISARLRNILTKRGSVTIGSQSIRFDISNAHTVIDRLAHRILTKKTQKFLLTELCNNNVRKALASFAYFLKYRDLRFNLFLPVRLPNAKRYWDDFSEDSWRQHLLDGLMIGDKEYYIDGDNGSPITNLFYFERDGVVDYCILYRILSALDWAARYVPMMEFQKWMDVLGYSSTLVRAAVEKLMRRGLVYSPESETKVASAHNLKISASGKMYLDELLFDEQYLINAVYDVPLPHASWSTEKRNHFETKLASIDELIAAVLLQESRELKRVIVRVDNAQSLGSIVHSGLLTSRMVRAAKGLISDAHYARFEKAREAADRFAARFRAYEADAKSADAVLTGDLLAQRLIEPNKAIRDVLVELGNGNEIQLKLPTHLSPADQNQVDVFFRFAESKDVTIPDTLTLLWQGKENLQFSELATLERIPGDSCHRGEFTISGLREICTFPPSRLTIFADANPMIVQNIGAPV